MWSMSNDLYEGLYTLCAMLEVVYNAVGSASVISDDSMAEYLSLCWEKSLNLKEQVDKLQNVIAEAERTKKSAAE